MDDNQKYTLKELLACVLSRELKDGTLGLVGASSLVPMAACMLAQEMHAPNLTWISGGSGYVNPLPPLVLSSSAYRSRAEAVLPMERVQVMQGRRIDFFFAGAMQVDKWGRINLVGVGNPLENKYTIRGPGSAGVSFSARAKRLFIYLNRHNKRIFVDNLDFVSAVPQKPEIFDEEKQKMKNHLLISPLGVFEFAPPSKSLYPISVHPNVSLEDVIRNTGFDFDNSFDKKNLFTTIEPSEEELEILRETVDPQKLLQKN
jgi:glutaconate CoA-transferase subunit B